LDTENIGQSDINYNYDITNKTITSVLNILTYIITSITGHPIHAAILAIISVDLHNCRYSICKEIKFGNLKFYHSKKKIDQNVVYG